MNEQYVGILKPEDPLYRFLANDVLAGVLGLVGCQPVFDVWRLNASTQGWYVFHYADRTTSTHLVGKFYGDKWIAGRSVSQDHRAALMQREFENLRRVRDAGFADLPYRVVRPLATNAGINKVLVEEYVFGDDLDHYILNALHYGQQESLYNRLTEIAGFLAELHKLGEMQQPVDPTDWLAALDNHIGHLAWTEVMSEDQHGRLRRLRDQWAASNVLNVANQVLIHGEPCPQHFVLDRGGGVTAIDLETMRRGDRAADIGCLAAEIKGVFFQNTGDPRAGDPYVQHLVASYARNLPAGAEDMVAFGRRMRFYMACCQARQVSTNQLELECHQREIDELEASLSI